MKNTPSIELDEITPEEFMKFPQEELDRIQYDIRKWTCQCKKCNKYTRIRDFGKSHFLDLEYYKFIQ